MQRNTRAWLSFSLPYVRSVPDSNGCRRFCRPLTKPLIQPTIHIQYGLQYPNATAKVSIFFHSATLSTTFFSSQPKKMPQKPRKRPVRDMKHAKQAANTTKPTTQETTTTYHQQPPRKRKPPTTTTHNFCCEHALILPQQPTTFATTTHNYCCECVLILLRARTNFAASAY